jgi:hypothetical protein
MPFPSAVFGEFQAGASARVGGGMKAHPCYLFSPAGRRRLAPPAWTGQVVIAARSNDAAIHRLIDSGFNHHE